MKFKDILAWVKGHIIIVVSCVLILAILPTCFILSRAWLSSILKKHEAAANAEQAKTKISVTYALPQVDPNAPAVTLTSAPNQRLTEWFETNRRTLLQQVEQMAGKGEAFNRGVGPDAQAVGRSEFKPLVEGFFPRPPLSAEQRRDPTLVKQTEDLRIRDMEDALLGKGGRPNPYQALLTKVRAGAAPDPARVLETLRDLRSTEMEKITSNARKLTDDEENRLKTQLQERRIAEYQGVASAISVYASLDMFSQPQGDGASGGRRGGDADVFSTIPMDSIPRVRQNRPRMFLNQWDLWVLSDLFSAVRLVNTRPNGQPTGVPESVVKRIVRVEVLSPEGMLPLEGREAQPADPMAIPSDPGTVPSPPIDRTRSFTGWIRSAANPLYEVRTVRVQAVVSSARAGDFIDALNKTNFIAVTDMDLTRVDPWAHLEEGYFYGNEHVVLATFTIESAWLKSWLLPLMPHELQTALGMTPPPEEQPAEGAGPT